MKFINRVSGGLVTASVVMVIFVVILAMVFNGGAALSKGTGTVESTPVGQFEQIGIDSNHYGLARFVDSQTGVTCYVYAASVSCVNTGK
jgi:hypothetical protein